MPETLRLCMAQMTSSNRYAPNIAFAENAAAYAAREGCDLLAMPEVSGLMTLTPTDPEAPIGAPDSNPFITACQRLAKEHGLWIHTLAQTPWGPWGLSICYDLRFPHLYRHYAQANAGVLFVPSAFTVPTGQAHSTRWWSTRGGR